MNLATLGWCLVQVAWSRPELVEAGTGPAVSDVLRGRVVRADLRLSQPLLWEWDGTSWLRLTPASGPAQRSDWGLAFDPVRGRTVLFGGRLEVTNRPTDDTWEWDGVLWTQLSPTTRPGARDGHAMVFDVRRGRTLLFGGREPSGLNANDTWEWDGTNWQQLLPATQPPPRSFHALAYDAGRGRGVLFGGDNSGLLSDTWEWDGSNWLAMTVPGPAARRMAGLAYDVVRGRSVLFGGYGAAGPTGDTLAWDGTQWTQLNPPASPTARSSHAQAYDPTHGAILVFGGQGNFGPLSDTWAWDGTTWTELPVPRSPGPTYSALTFDVVRQHVLMASSPGFISLGFETWTYDGITWTQRAPAASPPGRLAPAMTFDVQRGRAVLFGGNTLFGAFNDTWEWDGSQWNLVSTATPVPTGYGASIAYDAGRGQTVLFGGSPTVTGSGTPTNATQIWDGANWRVAPPGARPPARLSAAMVYDPRRDRILLFGGSSGAFGYYSDTWEWDGTNWQQRSPAHAPTGYAAASMCYDSARACVVLVASTPARPTITADTWEWNGTDWQLRLSGAPDVTGGRVAFDLRRERVVLHQFGTTREYGPTTPATYAQSGAGCAGSRGVPVLDAVPGSRPWIGTGFSVDVTNVPASGMTLLLLGHSNTRWGSLGLPFDLGVAGMPGCLLASSGDLVIALANASGSARWNTTLCACPELLGGRFYNQALVLDPGVNPAGLVLSNAAVGVIGAR